MPGSNLFVRTVRSLWSGLDFARRAALNLLFLGVVIAAVVYLLPDRGVRVARSTALTLAPDGALVEQLRGDPSERLILELLGRPERPETLMPDLLGAIERAREDDRVALLVLDLDRLTGGGLSKLQELRRAITGFRESGKRVVAVSDFYLQPHYYLAAAADEVALHPMGGVLLTGYGVSRRYYRELLDELEVEWNVFRVGEYKSAVEPYLLDGMSPEAREASGEWLGDLWRTYRRDVAESRGLAEAEIDAYVDGFHLRLAEHGGDAAELALEAGLVDRLATRDQVREWLIGEVGEDEETRSHRQIGHRAYLRAVGRPEREGDGTVGLVVAKGTILDGDQPPGWIGGESTARLIRAAREDEEVDAVVLRVDSPGGSAFAAELIRREVELTREAGKPVVASMGSVAASGGYWIAMSADEIWASPTTLTGSIGIYAMVPTFEGTLARIGIHADGVGTSPWAGTLRPEMSLPEEVKASLQLMIEDGYRDFVRKAAAGRGRSEEEIDRVARGRVWSGQDAAELGLVDQLGGLDEAMRAAAERAGLGETFGVRRFEKPPSRRALWMEWLLTRLGSVAGPALRSPLAGLWPRPGSVEETTWLAAETPFGLWAHCFCDPDADDPMALSWLRTLVAARGSRGGLGAE